MQTNADKGEEGVDCSGCQQLSIELRLVVLECSCAAFLIIPTVMALAVLNGPLRLLDVCCLCFLGLWHGSMHQLEVIQSQAIHL